VEVQQYVHIDIRDRWDVEIRYQYDRPCLRVVPQTVDRDAPDTRSRTDLGRPRRELACRVDGLRALVQIVVGLSLDDATHRRGADLHPKARCRTS